MKLLPEKQRREFVEKVSHYAIEGKDLYALKSYEIKDLFTEGELSALRNRIKYELIPKILELTIEWKSSYDKDEDAESHMQSLKDNFEIIENEFSEIPSIKDVYYQTSFSKFSKCILFRLVILLLPSFTQFSIALL